MAQDNRKDYYNRDRDRAREWERDLDDYRGYDRHKRSSRSPQKSDSKYEISKDPWDNQFQDSNFSRHNQPSFSQESSRYGNNYPSSYSNIYDDFPPLSSVPPAPQPPNISEWNRPQPPPAPSFLNPEDQIRKEAAIESEMRQQKAALAKQREEYIKKTNILKKELETLKDQRNELRGDSKRSPSPDTKRFLKENTKLQLEIQNKLKTIANVVDMLNGIIGEEAQQVSTAENTSEKTSKRRSRSPGNKKFNYVYYDPEMHWCRICNEFPPTAKDYLNHLHSSSHTKMAAQHVEAPWHSISGVNEGFPSYPSAPTKRTPIRGLQFFVPSTAWYCKLCDQFIGDLHCASGHLKSISHSKNYSNFVEQNPHWETDWMSDRQKAFEKGRHSKGKEESSSYTAHTIMFNKDGFHTKRKDSPGLSADDKKKKKNKNKRLRKRKTSTSSESSNSTSDSDHVKKKKKAKKQKDGDEPDDKTISSWMSSIQMDKLDESDRKLLDTLKARMKNDEQKRHSSQKPMRENERVVLDMHRKREDVNRERVRAEREMRERKEGARDNRAERIRTSPSRLDKKPPEIKKMPFIGKMPVFKNLTKPIKSDEQKKDEEKKKESDEALKKKREEMDAEIQKKVAEFKEKIAQAQLERAQAETVPMYRVPPPSLPPPVLPPVQPPPPLIPTHQPPPPLVNPQQPPSNLPKDFQEALDIIFPAEGKQPEPAKQEMFPNMPPPPFQIGPVPPTPAVLNYPPPSIPMMPQMMMNYDINPPQLFPHRPQLYDNHVPVVTQNSRPKQEQKVQATPQAKEPEKENGSVSKKKEVLDELAMLGIDASDVGSGI